MNIENWEDLCSVKFDMKTINNGTCKYTTYRGVKCIKNPMDYVMYQMIIFNVKPDLIIEIGTAYGGSSLYMADLLNIIGSGEIHTIDTHDICSDLVKNNSRIKRFVSGFENYNLSNADGFKKILVIDDASHSYIETKRALEKFNNIVSEKSYYIVEDGIINHLGMSDSYDGGPLRAVREFLESSNDFVIDRYLCDMFGKNATCNVNGYLKRIK